MGLLTDIMGHLDLEPIQLTAYIDEYESVQPYDCMISTGRAVLSFFSRDYEEAERWILAALGKNPANYMNHFYYALISKALGQWAKAANECWTTISLAMQRGTPSGWEVLEGQLNEVLNEVGRKLTQDELQRFVIHRNILHSPGTLFPAYYLCDQGKWATFYGEFLFPDRKKLYNDYICISAQSYVDGINHIFQQAFAQSGAYGSYALTPMESWKATKSKQIAVEKDYILAVAATAPNQTVTITPLEGNPVNINFDAAHTYHYVNMNEPGVFSSSQEFLTSKPISVIGNPQKKKIIITLRVNSVSQWYQDLTDWEYMPHTKEFFSGGTIFKNCYSTGEGSFPSECSLNTGLYSTHHHIIYRSSVCQFPEHIETAGEIFAENGYFTVSISGAVGSSPYIGGLRGFDCSRYKSCLGYPDSSLVEDALEFMEAFPNTNQYLSIGLFMPHTAVEYVPNGAFSHSMQMQTALRFRNLYSSNSDVVATEQRYRAALKETDRQLKKIYDYILSHYTEQEYVVCLHSEHGVTAVSESNYELKTERTNTVFMIRGSGVPACVSNEYVSHIDYLPALSKIAGVPFDFSGHDCILPRLLGGPGRDYVYTESINAGQTYKAAVRTDEFECRFESNANTDIDGLIDLSQGYTQKVFSRQTGEEIQDQELSEDLEAIVFDHIKENIKY